MEIQAQFPFLIEITHEDYGTFRFINSEDDVVFNGNLYQAAFFKIDPPDKDGSNVGNATLTISSIDQVWIYRIRGTQSPAKLTFVAAIVYEEDGEYHLENIEQYSFTLRAANWNDTTIQWTMVFDERMDIVTPCTKLTAQVCPGIA